MGEPIQREMVSGYVRRFGGWRALCEALAAALGVAPGDVIDVEAAGDPVVFVSARTQHGQFALRIEAFVDVSRAPAWSGKPALMAALARALGEDVLYDDGGSPVPYRWVLQRPDGARFEVFEDTTAAAHELILDASQPPVPLPPVAPRGRA